jgi:hypothetical protein
MILEYINGPGPAWSHDELCLIRCIYTGWINFHELYVVYYYRKIQAIGA